MIEDRLHEEEQGRGPEVQPRGQEVCQPIVAVTFTGAEAKALLGYGGRDWADCNASAIEKIRAATHAEFRIVSLSPRPSVCRHGYGSRTCAVCHSKTDDEIRADQERES